MGFNFESGRYGFEGIGNLNKPSNNRQINVVQDKVKPLKDDSITVIDTTPVPEPVLKNIPDKRDLVPVKSSLYGRYSGSYDFIKSTLNDLQMQKAELEINVLKDKISANDTTPAQKYILKAMLEDAEKSFVKMQKQQGIG